MLDGLVVALQGAPFGFLVAPAQVAQDPADVRTMVGDAELVFDDLGDARRGPQIGGVAVGQGTLQQELLETPQLPRGHLRRPSGRGAHLQGLPTATLPCIAPAHDGAGGAVQQPGDLVERAALVEQGKGTMATRFEKVSRTWRSWYGHPPPGYP